MLFLLFSPYIDSNLAKLVLEPLRDPASYGTRWRFTNIWDEVDKQLQSKSLSLFDSPSKKDLDLSPQEEETKDNAEGTAEENQNSEEKTALEEIFKIKRKTSRVHGVFTISQEHILLSQAVGIKTSRDVPETSNAAKNSPLDYFAEFMSKLVDYHEKPSKLTNDSLILITYRNQELSNQMLQIILQET